MPSTNNSNAVQQIVELTSEQKEQILELWEEGVYDTKALVNTLFPGKDGRSKEGVAVKSFLASKGLTPKTTAEYEKKEIELSEDQKQFVEAQAGSHKPLEITRLLFKNPALTNLSVEGRAVLKYYDTLDPKTRYIQADEEGGSLLQEYKAPRNIKEAITKVNKYTAEIVDEAKLTQRRRDELSFLVRFMNTHRYVYSINKLDSEQERTLYESSFVRFVHDKPDLTEEDVDLYINLCGDIVSHSRMMDEERTLKAMLLEEDEESGGGKRKMNAAMVEYLSQLRKDIGSNMNRQKKTAEDLTSKRGVRMETRINENASVLNLVEGWKDKKKRDRLIHQQMLRRQIRKTETDRLATMPGVMFEFFGIGTEEALDN